MTKESKIHLHLLSDTLEFAARLVAHFPNHYIFPAFTSMCCGAGVLSGWKCRNPSTSNPVGEDRKLKTLSPFTVEKSIQAKSSPIIL
ncbi:uncharacterized protein LACBIDRAFT_317688 [Laccaria bicolor S238N-H82]|uniref:Predicted protein n=1 Tax=Laccaria bicolor (strain S238N-H82 / ATCC MYA-4686) TaxID=486041 RepID=B0E274_LACBS|nr:uncharacterized protein LACBIDRAFT_317688 [Laccaria bicolor S238N-H82]EDQ99046.1 predicted protein [Laccaria bicolor S238N-H82]|eukprot:XP_001890289.1 predicted protein [Laccaria bicolor S238N-H82]